MTDMESLQKLITEVKLIVIDDLGEAFEHMKAVLPVNSRAYDDLLLIEAELQESSLLALKRYLENQPDSPQ